MKEQERGHFIIRERDRDDVKIYTNVFGIGGDLWCQVQGQPGVDLWKRAEYIVDCLNASERARTWDMVAEMKARRFLWLSHGHRGQYGDDGEMQCGECSRYAVTDYKRAPLADVVRAATQARIDTNLERLNA